MKVYVASPYTKGDHNENLRASVFAGDRLLEAGHTPFLPLLSTTWDVISPKTWEEMMEWSGVWLRACDVVVRLPGVSEGADTEVAMAEGLDIPVFYGVDAFLEGRG